MKKFLHKSLSIILALLVLCSTISVKIEKHFCGEVLVGVAIFSEAKKCTMEKMKTQQTTITKKSCCKDIVHIIQGQKELNLSSDDELTTQQQHFLQAFVWSYNYLFIELSEQKTPYLNYTSPQLVPDILVLEQVFLI